MSQRKDTIIIVHPFTSDKVLYEFVSARGYKIITLITDFDKNWIQQCMPTINQYSDLILKVSGDAKIDLSLIEQKISENGMTIKAVINSFDYSLYYSDTLANHFVDANINLAFSQIRMNKYLVNEELRKANVRSIKSTLINSVIDLENRQAEIAQLKFPIIIKPASDSAARNDVIIVETLENLHSQIRKLFNKKSIFHEKPHTQLLLQEYIEGDEFFVNTASFNGKHYTGGVFKYLKKGKNFLGIFSLDKDENTIADTLIQYNLECLDALQVSYGITHNEYIIDKNGEPYLIEINNRMAGVEVPKLSMDCYDSDEISAFLDALEQKTVKAFNSQNISAYGAIPFFSNFSNAEATTLDLSEIHSEYEILVFRPGIIDQTLNPDELFVKVSAVLLMINKNKEALNQDVTHLFLKEKEGSLFI